MLGQIQGGNRKGKQGIDNLFVLRTILEKGKGSKYKNLAAIFIDLSKAYDSVPHDKLWEHLKRMGINQKFITIMMSLYKDSTVIVRVNGHDSEQVEVKSGVRQGCPLSPLLFTLYMSDIGYVIENSPVGVNIWGKIISGLLFVDDIVLIGRNRYEVERLLKTCQYMFEKKGLGINCKKLLLIVCKEFAIRKYSDLSRPGKLLGPSLCSC